MICMTTLISKISVLRVLITPLSPNPAKWSNTLKQFVGKLPTNCLSVFDHFVGLAFKGLSTPYWNRYVILDEKVPI